MRKLTLAFSIVGAAVAAPAWAADLTVSLTLPTLPVAEYHRPYVATWIEGADGAAVQTLSIWYETSDPAEGEDYLKDLRTWWRKGGRSLALPADGVSGATRAPGRQTVTVPAARLTALRPGAYTLVVEAAREHGGREVVRVPFRWGAANTASAAGSTEMGAVRVSVTR